MAEARGESAWNHTSALLAAIWTGNTVWSKKPKVFKAEEFHPYAKAERKGIRITGDEIGLLTAALVPRTQGGTLRDSAFAPPGRGATADEVGAA